MCFFSFCWLLFGQKARKLRTDHCKVDARTSYESSMQRCFKSPVDPLYIYIYIYVFLLYRGVVFAQFWVGILLYCGMVYTSSDHRTCFVSCMDFRAKSGQYYMIYMRSNIQCLGIPAKFETCPTKS